MCVGSGLIEGVGFRVIRFVRLVSFEGLIIEGVEVGGGG